MNLSSVMIDLFGHQRQVFLRSESVGDSGAYQQVITNEDYKVDFWAQGLSLDQYYKSLVSKGITPLIVDLGANIGMSALYFACRYPKAKIYAIEPNNANFSMLKMNTVGLSIDYFEAAIGSSEGMANLSDPGLSDWGFRVGADSDGIEVPVIDMTKLINVATSSGLVPFLCKIDIEGGEKELFSRNTSWFKLFPTVIVELHDWMLPFQNSSRGFLDTLAQSGYELIHRGENSFCFDPRLKSLTSF